LAKDIITEYFNPKPRLNMVVAEWWRLCDAGTRAPAGPLTHFSHALLISKDFHTMLTKNIRLDGGKSISQTLLERQLATLFAYEQVLPDWEAPQHMLWRFPIG
jgi:hypothetical protein